MTLHLVLKRKWWNLIERKEKSEEYREILFWCVRLLDIDRNNNGNYQKSCRRDFENLKNGCFINLLKKSIESGKFRYKNYDTVYFHLGYTNIIMLYEFKGVLIGYGNPKWGAPTDKEVFKIKLGKKL